MDSQNGIPLCLPVNGGIFVFLAGSTYFISNTILPHLDRLSSDPTSESPSEYISNTTPGSNTPFSTTGQVTRSTEHFVNGSGNLEFPTNSMPIDYIQNDLFTLPLSQSQEGAPASHFFNDATTWPTLNTHYLGPQLIGQMNFSNPFMKDPYTAPSPGVFQCTPEASSSETESPATSTVVMDMVHRRPRKDKGKSKQANNLYGRRGKLRCTPCR